MVAALTYYYRFTSSRQTRSLEINEVRSRDAQFMTNIQERKFIASSVYFSEMKIAVYFLVLITSGLTLSHKDIAVSKVRNSLPEQILGCMQKFNLLRCLKYFLLLRLESQKMTFATDQFTANNFFEMILQSSEVISDDFPKKYHKLDEEQLNSILTEKIQKFFKNQPITLKFIPNMPVKIVPINTKSGEIEFSIKRERDANFLSRKIKNSDEDSSEENDSAVNDKKDDGPSDKQAMRRKGNFLQVGIPLLLTPIMIFFGILPFLIPVLKLATAVTSVINLAALVGSIMFLGKYINIFFNNKCLIYLNLHRTTTFN